MKEDAQLTCPISYEDPNGCWEKIKAIFENYLPLKDVSWKNPSTSAIVNIPQLPVRFLPSSASLFKDTEHSFRWFLSAYCNVYVLVADSLDVYKTVRPVLKRWVDQQNAAKGTLGKVPWVILYVAWGTFHLDAYQKVYKKVSGDFYTDKVGDRSVFLCIPPEHSLPSSSLQLSSMLASSCTEFTTKLKEGIMTSFQHRCTLYELDIRRLELTRGSAAFDFKQVFLVRESLALLYQMMQVSDMALLQYEELENLLNTIPPQNLPDNDWPMLAPEPFKIESKDKEKEKAESTPPASGSAKDTKEKDCMSDAIRNGDEIVTYSINLARMKILKNKFSFWELKRYVFSRQMFLLVMLKKPVLCAQRALRFLVTCSDAIEDKHRLPMDKHITENGNLILSIKESLFSLLRLRQLDCWALAASLKLTRVCRDLIDKIFQSTIGKNENQMHNSASQYHNQSMNMSATLVPTWDPSVSTMSQTVQTLLSLESRGNASPGRFASINTSQTVLNPGIAPSGIAATNSTTSQSILPNYSNLGNNSRSFTFSEQYGDLINESYLKNPIYDRASVCKEAFPVFCDLLEFALQKFQRLCYVIKYAKVYHDPLIQATMKPHLTAKLQGSSQIFSPLLDRKKHTEKKHHKEEDNDKDNENISESSGSTHEEGMILFVGEEDRQDSHTPTTDGPPSVQGLNNSVHQSGDITSNRLKNAQRYFQQFYDQGKITTSSELLHRELIESKFFQENNLEVVLQSGLVSRVRSVSHFWAKIYQVDLDQYSYTGGLISVEDFILSQSALLSRNQLEKGRVLEVSIALYIYKCFFEMHNLCQRYRFATTSKMKMLQLLSCVEQHQILFSMVRTMLQQSQLRPSDIIINNTMSINTSTAAPLPNTSVSATTIATTSAMTAKIEIPSELKLWLYEIYLHSASRMDNAIEYRTALTWLTLYEYYNHYCRPYHHRSKTYRGMTYDSSNGATSTTNTTSSLTISTNNDSEAKHSNYSLHSVFQSVSWMQHLMYYSMRHFFQLEQKPIFLECRSMISLRQFTFGRLPGMESRDAEDNPSEQEQQQQHRCFIKGYELINEERYPATALQYVCNHQRFLLSLRFYSYFPFPVEVDNITLIFKKIHSESFKSNFGMLYSIPSLEEEGGRNSGGNDWNHEDQSMTPEGGGGGGAAAATGESRSFGSGSLDRDFFSQSPKSPPRFLSRNNSLSWHEKDYPSDKDYLFTLGKDELVFCPIGVSTRPMTDGAGEAEDGSPFPAMNDRDETSTIAGSEKIILYPGDQELIFEFQPQSLGEYAFDRFYLTINSSIVLYNYPILNSFGLRPEQVHQPISYKDIPLTHEAIQSYFDEYPLIRITEPEEAIVPQIHSSILSPLSQQDYCLFTFDVHPNDCLEEMIMMFPSMESVDRIHRRKGITFPEEDVVNNNLDPSRFSGNFELESPPSNNTFPSSRSRTRTITPLIEPDGSTFVPSSGRRARPVSTTNGSFSVRSRGDTDQTDTPTSREKFSIQILPLQEWKFYYLPRNIDPSGESRDPSNEEEMIPIEPVITSMSNPVTDSSITFTNLKGNGKVMICIPFIPIQRQKFSSERQRRNILYRCTMNFYLQLRLQRKLCRIPLQIFSQTTVYCGSFLTSTTASSVYALVPSSTLPSPTVTSPSPIISSHIALHQHIATIQVELMNIFDYSLELLGYQLTSYLAHPINPSTVREGNPQKNVSETSFFQLLQGNEEIPEVSHLTALLDSSATAVGMRKGVTIESKETYSMSIMGNCEDLDFLFKIRFYFIRNDALSHQELFKDLVFTYDTSPLLIQASSAHLEKCPVINIPNETDATETKMSNDPSSVSLQSKRIQSATFAKIYEIQGIVTYQVEKHYGKFSILSGFPQHQSNNTSLSVYHYLQPFQKYWKLFVKDTQFWIVSGMQSEVIRQESEMLEIKVCLYLLPVMMGTIPAPCIEVIVLSQPGLDEVIERSHTFRDESLSEIDVFPVVTTTNRFSDHHQIRQYTPLIVSMEEEPVTSSSDRDRQE